jgi:hypothetical protein
LTHDTVSNVSKSMIKNLEGFEPGVGHTPVISVTWKDDKLKASQAKLARPCLAKTQTKGLGA